MSTAAIAAASASATAVSLNTARQNKCIAVLNNYTPSTATTTEMQEYADCVDYIHPHVTSTAEIVLVKVAFVFILFTIGFFIYKENQRYYSDLSDLVCAGVMGLLVGMGSTIALYLFAYGCYFLIFK